jgi:hypothetical protein
MDWYVLCFLSFLFAAPLDYCFPYPGPAAKNNHKEVLVASISVEPCGMPFNVPTMRAFFDVDVFLVDAVLGFVVDGSDLS